MRCVITGAAGFIGSHLAQAALQSGDSVVGIDSLTDYYDVSAKRANLAALQDHPEFRFVESDLLDADLPVLFADTDVVFHLAGQPGVRLSWSSGFDRYVTCNVIVTQRVLEAAVQARPGRVVYASSSSVYGNAAAYPTREDMVPAPYSPYGVTKLAAEHLCGLYAANHGVATTALRYFTVYGPRQRHDMGMHRFISAALAGRPLPIFGDGEQVRDFTYVADVVAATRAAGTADVPAGAVINIAGGGSITVNELVEMLSEITGRELQTQRLPEQAGDVRATAGSIDRARELLGWTPSVGMRDGLAAQTAWLAGRR